MSWQNPNSWAVLLIVTGTVAFIGMSLAHSVVSRFRGSHPDPVGSANAEHRHIQMLSNLVNEDLALQRAPIDKMTQVLDAAPLAPGDHSVTTDGLVRLERFLSTELADHLVTVSDAEIAQLANQYQESVLLLCRLLEPAGGDPQTGKSVLIHAWENERSTYAALSRRVNELLRSTGS